MNLSMKWLSDFIKIDMATREFTEAMTMSGSKVEGYKKEGEEISNVLVGQVLSVTQHPDADKLVVCQINVGLAEPVQIVTGATNVKVGDFVPAALDGSTLCNGVKIKKGKLRGVESQGMLCSIAELGLSLNDFPYAIEDGIFILQEDCQIGQDIKEAIGINDTIVEFEITSNRPDCLSVIGLAREAHATFNVPLTINEPKVLGSGGDINELLKVTVENSELCTRYVAKVVKNVKIEPSPRWLRERLRASGVRSINNLVDITNYVMLEYGHPMHAFDYKYLEGGSIVVRNARVNETITTLDGDERALSADMLVIADAKKPVAVAGIMGGEYSGIFEDTNIVVFEAACFVGNSVRMTAKKLGMRTESSARFEKGLDPNDAMPAILRAVELVELLCAGEVVDGIIDIASPVVAKAPIKLEVEWINKFLGLEISKERMVEILKCLGFEVVGDEIYVPSFRIDIEHKADIAEEIARIYGYNNIPTTTFKDSSQGKLSDRQKFERKIHTTLLGQGLNEIITLSFISPKYYDKIRLPENSPLRDSVTIINPLGEDTSIMRTTTIPSMLETLALNNNNRNPVAFLYEIATAYVKNPDDVLPFENQHITIGMYGNDTDYFSVKGIVEELLSSFSILGTQFNLNSQNPTFHPGRCADIVINDTICGVIGEIHPLVVDNYGLLQKTFVATINVDAIYSARQIKKLYTPLPKFPSVTRDLAIICDIELPVQKLEEAIRSANKKIVEAVSLFDVYTGKQIAEGKKSVAYSITMRSAEKTLTDEDADGVVKKILKACLVLGAELRL